MNSRKRKRNGNEKVEIVTLNKVGFYFILLCRLNPLISFFLSKIYKGHGKHLHLRPHPIPSLQKPPSHSFQAVFQITRCFLLLSSLAGRDANASLKNQRSPPVPTSPYLRHSNFYQNDLQYPHHLYPGPASPLKSWKISAKPNNLHPKPPSGLFILALNHIYETLKKKTLGF